MTAVYPAIEKNRIFPYVTTQMDLLEGIVLTEISQDRGRQILCIFTYLQNLKNKQMSITKQKQIHRYKEQTRGYQHRKGKRRGNIVGED